jgi:hypothetical protein
MRAIRRVGSPSILNRLSPSAYQVAVKLDGAPPAPWVRFFQDTESWSGTRHPLFVDVKGNSLVFESSEDGLPNWIEDLDRWIRTANQACAEMFV